MRLVKERTLCDECGEFVSKAVQIGDIIEIDLCEECLTQALALNMIITENDIGEDNDTSR